MLSFHPKRFIFIIDFKEEYLSRRIAEHTTEKSLSGTLGIDIAVVMSLLIKSFISSVFESTFFPTLVKLIKAQAFDDSATSI